MWKSLDKSILPEYDWIILGKWDEEEENMAWKVGRMLHDKTLEFFPSDNAAAYARDSVSSFDPEDSTHFIDIPNQPERSKREDSQLCCEMLTKLKYIFRDNRPLWDGSESVKKLVIDLIAECEMRCSEHCGNTVRDK